MQRRKLLAGMGSLAAGGAAVMGTGAFSRSTAQRKFSLTIEPDDTGDAYLNLIPGSNQYAEYDSGVLELSFQDNGQGEGITSRANTRFDDVFRVENQGTNTVDVLLPSFESVANDDLKNAAGPASVQYLIDEGDSPESDPKGAVYKNGSPQNTDVDQVDISWPKGKSPRIKPSNPIPQGDPDDNETGTGNLNQSYEGVRYPGGAARLDPGESVTIDVRFTVSNERDAEQVFDTSFLTRAVEASASTEDWAI